MGAVVALDSLLASRRVWRGRAGEGAPGQGVPTGHAALDARLPGGGWPAHALSEILFPADGLGELALVWPVLARLTAGGGRVLLVAPPYRPHAPAWQAAGIDLASLHVVDAEPRDALWATEQCLRSAACAAVLCWPRRVDDRALRRLQVAAETGRCLGFAFRDARAARESSPAALRLQLEEGGRVRVLKSRGGLPPAAAIAFAGA